MMIDNTATHEVEVNFFYLHYRDAKKLTEWAERESSKLRSLYARHAILAMVFASEALINRVLSRLPLSAPVVTGIEKLGIREKWALTPIIATHKLEAKPWFDSSHEPFQSFCELICIRNWLVHPKAGEFVDAWVDAQSTISILEKAIDIPWVETLEGRLWSQTRIPVNPFELTGQHARKAIEVLDRMIEELQGALGDNISNDWLWGIDLKTKQGDAKSRIAIESLWGGYTPNPAE